MMVELDANRFSQNRFNDRLRFSSGLLLLRLLEFFIRFLFVTSVTIQLPIQPQPQQINRMP